MYNRICSHLMCRNQQCVQTFGRSRAASRRPGHASGWSARCFECSALVRTSGGGGFSRLLFSSLRPSSSARVTHLPETCTRYRTCTSPRRDVTHLERHSRHVPVAVRVAETALSPAAPILLFSAQLLLAIARTDLLLLVILYYSILRVFASSLVLAIAIALSSAAPCGSSNRHYIN